MSASLAANSSRPGNGARKAAAISRAQGRGSLAGGAMFHLDNGCGAQPHEPLRWVFKANTNRKALGHLHPVERALDIGDRAGKVDTIGVEHAGTDALNHTLDRLIAVDHRKDRRAIANRDGIEVRLAEVRDR